MEVLAVTTYMAATTSYLGRIHMMYFWVAMMMMYFSNNNDDVFKLKYKNN